MINYVADYYYVNSEETKLFTVVLLPESMGKFPAVIVRTPYVDRFENEKEENIAIEYLNDKNFPTLVQLDWR